MKNIITVLVSVFVFWSTCWAEQPVSPQTEPALPTVEELQSVSMTAWSPDVARLRAMGLVRAGRIKIFSDGMIGEKNINVTGSNMEDVLNKLSEVPLEFEVVNLDDWVFMSISLWGDDGEGVALFYGGVSKRAKDWESHEHVSLVVNKIPVLTGVAQAEAWTLNPDGSTWSKRAVYVKDGRVIVSSWLMGVTNAMLVAYFQDGTIKTYRLNEPSAGSPSQSYEASFSVADHYVYNGHPAEINLVVSERPTVEVNIADSDGCKTTSFNIVGVNSDGQEERPLAMVQATYVYDGELRIIGMQEPGSDGRFTLDICGPGNYHFFFIWDHFGSKGAFYTSGDGKG